MFMNMSADVQPSIMLLLGTTAIHLGVIEPECFCWAGWRSVGDWTRPLGHFPAAPDRSGSKLHVNVMTGSESAELLLCRSPGRQRVCYDPRPSVNVYLLFVFAALHSFLSPERLSSKPFVHFSTSSLILWGFLFCYPVFYPLIFCLLLCAPAAVPAMQIKKTLNSIFHPPRFLVSSLFPFFNFRMFK